MTGALARPSARRAHQTNINGTQYIYPVCSVCHRDVEAFTWSDHASHATGEATRTFFVMCHGETETVSLKLADMRSGEMRNFQIEYAFAPAPLPAVEIEVKALPE